MALKRNFTDEEKVGLTQQEIEIGEKYLRKHKTAGALSTVESLKVYELFMVGCSFNEIHQQFPQYEIGQIILTAALGKWGLDRDKMQSTLRDRVKAKVIKSVIEQTDFLTSMLSVASAEHMKGMREYIVDQNNPVPKMRIKSIKEYKEVTDTLAKIVQGATPSARDNKHSPMFDALAPQHKQLPDKQEKPKKEDEDDAIDIDALLEQEKEGR